MGGEGGVEGDEGVAGPVCGEGPAATGLEVDAEDLFSERSREGEGFSGVGELSGEFSGEGDTGSAVAWEEGGEVRVDDAALSGSEGGEGGEFKGDA